jgi:hypothetical protein
LVTEWQPLSVRRGIAKPDGPYEGVPPHLLQALVTWLWSVLGTRMDRRGEAFAEAIGLRLRIEVGDEYAKAAYVIHSAKRDEDLFLDVVDMALRAADNTQVGRLRNTLGMGGSVWTVADDGTSLVRRVSESEQDAYERTVSPADEIADELRTAWAAVYGRNPDPSDGDHAIKAVELSLWQIVTPNKANSTLGVIIARLQQQADRFAFRLATSSTQTTSIEALVQMLRLMWPNPDRHGTGERRAPELLEAENVVQLAVLIVGWARSEVLAATMQQ